MQPHEINSASDEVITHATDEYFRLADAGSAPELEAFVANYPQVVDALRRIIPALDAVRKATGGLEFDGENLGSGNLDTAVPLGDFLLHREIGRGGMGVVYEATQLSLSRRVAVKVLPFAATLDENRIKRFRNESLAVAALDHPNIVEVYGVGCERGVHYYAMRYIEGCSLADIVSSQSNKQVSEVATQRQSQRDSTRSLEVVSTDEATQRSNSTVKLVGEQTLSSFSVRGSVGFRTVAGVIAQVARALEHAHRQGIVHRDIKPSNLMIDANGKPWVTDFGLAQVVSSDSLTLTGDLVGTLRYMSPEQVGNDPIDYRTDIYSLGATLYELLALRPMFSGNNSVDLLQQIRHDSPQRPTRIDASIPRELETIILKATDKEVLNRYSTAAALADDLQAWLDGKPIAASPITSLARTWRWSRRNPLVASLVAATCLLLACVAAVSSSAALQISRQRDQIGAQRDAISTERDRAMSAIRTMTSNRAIDFWGEGSALTIDQRTFFEEVVELFAAYTVADHSHGDQAQKANAFQQMGSTLSLLGRAPEAIEAYRHAIQLQKEIVADFPMDMNLVRDLARTRRMLGRELNNIADWPAAEHQLGLAVGDWEALLQTNHGATEDDRLDFAKCLHSYGAAFNRQGKWVQAREKFDHSLELCEALSIDTGNYDRTKIETIKEAASILHSRAIMDKELSNFDASIMDLDAAISLLEDLRAAGQGNRQVRSLLTVLHSTCGNSHRHLDHFELAKIHHRQAVALAAALVADYPNIQEYLSDLASHQNNLAVLLVNVKEYEEAESLLLALVKLYDRLIELTPGDVNLRVSRAGTISNTGKLYEFSGNNELAVEWFELAIESTQAILAEYPAVDRAGLFQRNATWARAKALDMLQRHKEAKQSWEHAKALDTRENLDIDAGLALNRARLGDSEFALAEAERLLATDTTDREVLFDVARIFAVEAERTTDDDLAEDLTIRTIAELTRAIDSGFYRLELIDGEPAFEAFFTRPEFQNQRARLETLLPR